MVVVFLVDFCYVISIFSLLIFLSLDNNLKSFFASFFLIAVVILVLDLSC